MKHIIFIRQYKETILDMLGLAKLRLQQQKIDKKEFMMIARKAAENIKIAKKCFETTS